MQGDLMERIVESYQAENAPLQVLFEVTHRCNLPCVHCYLPNHRDNGELTFAEVCEVLDQLAAAGTVFLTFTGGEVLSRTDFLEIVDAAADRGFVVKVLTNGTLITDEVADRFAAAGVIEVSISVYGASAEIHDQVTNMPGSYHRTMEGIVRLRARGLHVVMKTPLLTLNGALARDLHQMAMMHNLPCNFDLSITPKSNGDPAPLELAMQRETMVSMMLDPILRDVMLNSAENPAGPEPCSAGRGYCAIGPTGDLMPCSQMPFVVGNLRERRFDDMWAADPFLKRLRSLTREDYSACTGCGVKGVCSRCPGTAYKRGQDIDGCDLSAREVARARVEARMRLSVVK